MLNSQETNPYEPPNYGNTAEQRSLPAVNVYEWEGHTISVTAELIPKFLPLIGQFWISIDGGTPFTSTRLRWNERIDFVIRDNGREIPAMLESYGTGFGRQPFRILVNGKVVVDSIVAVQRGRIGFLIGVLIGIAILPVLALVVIVFLKMIA
jgi:hypothetical protein